MLWDILGWFACWPNRTFDFKLRSREDFDGFVPNLLKHHEALLQNDTGQFNDFYEEVTFRKSS